MGLFNFGKKKDEVKEPSCACNAPVEEVKQESCCCRGGNEVYSCCEGSTASMGKVLKSADVEKLLHKLGF